MLTNPYEPTGNESKHDCQFPRAFERIVSLVWLVAYLYPLLALGGVYVVVFMHDVLKMPGAIIGCYETPMGVAFNLSVFVIIGVVFVGPAGLIWSFFPPSGIRKLAASHSPLLPVYFVLISAFTIAMVYLDPWRVVEIYQD